MATEVCDLMQRVSHGTSSSGMEFPELTTLCKSILDIRDDILLIIGEDSLLAATGHELLPDSTTKPVLIDAPRGFLSTA